jgi:hypothetical protein
VREVAEKGIPYFNLLNEIGESLFSFPERAQVVQEILRNQGLQAAEWATDEQGLVTECATRTLRTVDPSTSFSSFSLLLSSL